MKNQILNPIDHVIETPNARIIVRQDTQVDLHPFMKLIDHLKKEMPTRDNK